MVSGPKTAVRAADASSTQPTWPRQLGGAVAGKSKENLVEARLAEREAGDLGPLPRQQRETAGRGVGRGRAVDPGGQDRRVRALDDGHAQRVAKDLPGENGVTGVRQLDAEHAGTHRGLELPRRAFCDDLAVVYDRDPVR